MSNEPERSLARADLCRFVAACYYEPGPEFAEERLFDSLAAAAERADADLARSARDLREAFSAQPLGELLVDYARLFLGPGATLATPYGSVWLSGEDTLMQDSTMAVLALYEEAGFELDEAFREVPDHIAVELEFLYLLLYRECEAEQGGNERERENAIQLRRRFLDEHVGRWVAPFAAAVESGAETAFYRELAQFTKRTLRLAGSLA